MMCGKESDLENTKFKEVVLPPGMLDQPNDEVLGLIPGDAFARAYYKIWLGDFPVSETFRDRILVETTEGGA